ncbi:HGGxSTG domain-containing protein [Mesorhizobium australicum]|uniref:HGGxSTG domain-containing protein n=1 Tax=Mesorhizobium australicum TaxID=536018 RepID=UPI00333A53E5
MHSSPRCGAKTRSAHPCKSPAMPNGRCRLHGGKSPGAPRGNSNALKHGRYSAEAMAERRRFRDLLAEIKEVIELVG